MPPTGLSKSTANETALEKQFVDQRDPSAAFAFLAQKFNLRFERASLTDQAVITTPGGIPLFRGKQLADSFSSSPSLTDQILGKLPQSASSGSHGAIECRKCRLNEDYFLGLQIGFTNHVRPERPTLTLALVSKAGFSMELLEELLGNEPQKELLLINTLSGSRGDISYLQDPYAKLIVNPDSLEQCTRIIERFSKISVRARNELEQTCLPPIPHAG